MQRKWGCFAPPDKPEACPTGCRLNGVWIGMLRSVGFTSGTGITTSRIPLVSSALINSGLAPLGSGMER